MTNKFKEIEQHKMVFKKSKLNKHDFENQQELENYYMRLKMLAISVFEWKNLPNGIDSVYLERILFEQGKAVMFKDVDMMTIEKEIPFLALKVALNSRLNVYGIPIYRKAYANNGYQKLLNENNSVIIYDNILHQNLDIIIYTYAQRLANVERIIDVNLNHTRHPFIISTDEKAKEMIEKIFDDISKNKPYVIVDESFSQQFTKGTEVLNLNAPFVVDKLMDYKHTLMNEVLTILGIGNSSQDKRERLLSDEMKSVSQLNEAYSQVRLRARKQACEQLKKMFPKELANLEVDFVITLEKESGDKHDIQNNND